MRAGGVTNAIVTSSLLESVWFRPFKVVEMQNWFYLFYFSLLYESTWLLIRSKFYCTMWSEICIFNFQVESADLIAYGLIPEFIGRFAILVSLSALTEDQLVEVTTKALVFGFTALHVLLILSTRYFTRKKFLITCNRINPLLDFTELTVPMHWVKWHLMSTQTFCKSFG